MPVRTQLRSPCAILLVTRRPAHWAELRARLSEFGIVRICESVRAVRASEHRDAVMLADLAHPEFASGGPDVLHAARRPLVGLVVLGAGDPGRDALDFQAASAAGAIDFIASGEPAELSARRIEAALRSQLLERMDEAQTHARDRSLEVLSAACERARRAKTNVGVLCFDLELVRQMAGGMSAEYIEAWMRALGARLRECCRNGDRITRPNSSRRGGDVERTSRSEYILVLHGPLDQQALLGAAKRISAALRQPLEVEGQRVAAYFHVGAALWDSQAGPAEVAQQSRAAACWARRRGPCSIELYSDDIEKRTKQRLSLETALRDALESGEFLLHYQPRVSVDGLKTVALEALVRWQHPRLGLVPPGEFISLAEETGLIVPLGQWVLEQACLQARRWQDEGFEPVRMAVNVSPMQFRDPQFLDNVQHALARSGLDPSWLELELTESMLMQDVDDVVATMRRLKELGISISVDDFGTGYSALAYLRRFPIDALKIDRSFLREVTREPDDASIATAIVLMAKCLRLRVVGEGVETPGQLAFLRIMKCDEAQGYHFARPLPADEVTRFLETRAGPSAASAAAAA